MMKKIKKFVSWLLSGNYEANDCLRAALML